MTERTFFIILASIVLAALVICVTRYTAKRKFAAKDGAAEIRLTLVVDEEICDEIHENWEARAILKNGIMETLEKIQNVRDSRRKDDGRREADQV